MSVLQRATRLLDWICAQRMAKQTVVYLTCILVIQCVCKTARREIRKLLSARISHSSCSVSSLRIWFLLSAKPWGNFRASKLRKVINLQNVGVAISGVSGRRCFFSFFFYKAHLGIINKSQRTKPFFAPKTLLVFKSPRTTQTPLLVVCQGFISCLKRIRNCQLPNSEEQQHGH